MLSPPPFSAVDANKGGPTQGVRSHFDHSLLYAINAR